MKKRIIKIILTGADGYIGRNLLKYLLKKKYHIYVLSKKIKKNKKNVFYIKGDLNTNFFPKIGKIDIIIHCASKGVYKTENKKKIIKTNYFDSLNFFRRAYSKKIFNWIILGTSGEYGYKKNGPMSVNSPLKPVNAYGKSKVMFFKKIANKKNFKLAKKIYLRLFHVYGLDEPKKRLYPSLLKAINKNIAFKMSTGSEIRDFIYIKRVVKKIEESFKYFRLNNYPFLKIKHIASGKPTTVINFVKRVCVKKKTKIKILTGNIKQQNYYFSMYSNKKSLL